MNHPPRGRQGFTLLEVMIAMAILALVLVTGFWAQSRSVELENEAKWNTISGLLIQRLMSEMMTASVDDIKTGTWDIGSAYPGFSLSLEGGTEPFPELKDLKEFRLELKGPIEGLTYKTKVLIYTKDKK